MSVNMLFVIGAPRSGTTMLEHMLSAHSMVQGGPEPHLLTPLAHLGPWAKVDKAPYDHVLAAESQRLGLPVADPIRSGAAFDALVDSCLA